jgi:hypothetical protein
MSRRRLALVATLLAAALLGPGPAVAAQPDGSCGAERGSSFTLPVPDALRTDGVHRFQYRITVTLPDGTLDVATTDNQIEVTTAATRYENVHLRLVRNRGLLADGTVDVDVHAMRPDQAAAFYGQMSLAKADADIVATTVMEVRWEGRRNQWSAWTPLARGPVNSFCPQLKDSILIKSYGWAG